MRGNSVLGRLVVVVWRDVDWIVVRCVIGAVVVMVTCSVALRVAASVLMVGVVVEGTADVCPLVGMIWNGLVGSYASVSVDKP